MYRIDLAETKWKYITKVLNTIFHEVTTYQNLMDELNTIK